MSNAADLTSGASRIYLTSASTSGTSSTEGVRAGVGTKRASAPAKAQQGNGKRLRPVVTRPKPLPIEDFADAESRGMRYMCKGRVLEGEELYKRAPFLRPRTSVRSMETLRAHVSQNLAPRVDPESLVALNPSSAVLVLGFCAAASEFTDIARLQTGCEVWGVDVTDNPLMEIKIREKDVLAGFRAGRVKLFRADAGAFVTNNWRSFDALGGVFDQIWFEAKVTCWTAWNTGGPKPTDDEMDKFPGTCGSPEFFEGLLHSMRPGGCVLWNLWTVTRRYPTSADKYETKAFHKPVVQKLEAAGFTDVAVLDKYIVGFKPAKAAE